MTSGSNATSASGSGESDDSSDPAVPMLAVYTVAAGVLLAVAVAVVCTAVVCRKRRERRYHYPTTSKTKRTAGKASRHTSAGTLTGQDEQRMPGRTLDTAGVPGGNEVELEEHITANHMDTEQTTPTTYPQTQQLQAVSGDYITSSESIVLPEIRIDTHEDSDTREGVGGRRENECRNGDRREMEGEGEDEETEPEREGGGVPYQHDQERVNAFSENGQKSLSPEFAFEDGSVLKDYPSSTDLEVMSDSENTLRVNFMGHRDIYNSWILQTDSTLHQEHLAECSVEQSIECCPVSEVKENTFPTIPALVVSQTDVQENRVGSSQAPLKVRKMPPALPSLEEAQMSLDKSVADLLELTNTLSQEAKEAAPQAGPKERGYCSLEEYQSRCDDRGHLHEVTPTSPVPPPHGSVPCPLNQDNDAVSATLSPSTPSLKHPQGVQSSLVPEQRAAGDQNLDPDIQNTEGSDDLLLISHV